jgi:hypothetical protein
MYLYANLSLPKSPFSGITVSFERHAFLVPHYYAAIRGKIAK